MEDKLRTELAPEFEILRLLGQGSMSRVFVARETGLGRLVAIKVLSPQLNLDEVARKRFEREGRSAAKISHRNVTAMYRVGSLADGTPFLVMEYVEGRNLSDLLQATGPMDVERARERFGFSAGISLDAGLRETIDWYRSHREIADT